MVKLPEELIADILSRLPVKPLLRFRSVSKTWCALIDNKHFHQKHLNRSIVTKSTHTLSLFQFRVCSVTSVSNLFSPQHSPLLTDNVTPNLLVNLHYGYCNGLHCLVLVKDPGYAMVVSNPATRKHVKFPFPSDVLENPFTEDGSLVQENLDVVYGFGYDSVSDDYRVVMLVQFFEGKDRVGFRSGGYVYSLGSCSWRKVLGFPSFRFVPLQMRCVLVSGALHLFIMVENEEKSAFQCRVASFDLATEECKVITLPNFVKLGLYKLDLSELGGCLAIVCSYFEAGVVSVWVMKDYGVTESWTQLLTVGSEIVKPFENFMPLAYSESGEEVLLMVKNKLGWYNLENKTFKLVDVSGLPETSYPVICLESLVSLGENAENDATHGGKKKGAKKERKGKFLSAGFKLVL